MSEKFEFEETRVNVTGIEGELGKVIGRVTIPDFLPASEGEISKKRGEQIPGRILPPKAPTPKSSYMYKSRIPKQFGCCCFKVL